MKCRIIDFCVGFNRKQRLELELDGDFKEQFNLLKDEELDVTVKKFRHKRSLDANAYAWVLISKIAAELSVDKVIVYQKAIQEIGGVSETICIRNPAVPKFCESWQKNGLGWKTETFPSKFEGYTNVTVYYGSSTYDTKQMSLLIDHLVEDAKTLGIETLTPAELERMISNVESH